MGQWEEGDDLTLDGRRVGTITSLARAPGGEEVVGLGYVRLADATVGKRFYGEGEGQWVEVVAVSEALRRQIANPPSTRMTCPVM